MTLKTFSNPSCWIITLILSFFDYSSRTVRQNRPFIEASDKYLYVQICYFLRRCFFSFWIFKLKVIWELNSIKIYDSLSGLYRFQIVIRRPIPVPVPLSYSIPIPFPDSGFLIFQTHIWSYESSKILKPLNVSLVHTRDHISKTGLKGIL